MPQYTCWEITLSAQLAESRSVRKFDYNGGLLSLSLLRILLGADFGLYFCVMCPQKLLMAAMIRIFGHQGLYNQLLPRKVPPARGDC